MGLKIEHLAKQLNLPIEQLILKLKQIGIRNQFDRESELTEEELKRFYLFYESFKKTQPKHTPPQNHDSEINEKDKKAFQYMNHIILQCEIIFIDTSSLLQESNSVFLNRLFGLLKNHNKKLILPYKVYKELDKHQKNKADKKLSKLAIIALKHLVEMQKAGYLEIYGDESLDNFADNVFNTQITRLRVKHSVLLITNDIKLGKDILSLNNSRSVKGKTIHVQKVNQFGFFQKVHLDDNHTSHSGSGRKIPEQEKFKIVKSLTPIPQGVLKITKEVKEGDVLYTDKNTSVRLNKEIGSGGEGSVYLTNDENIVAKIYKKEKLTYAKYEKLKLMVSKKINYKGICYPIDLLFNSQNEFVGYTMPVAKGKELKNFLFIPKKVFLQRNPNWTRTDLVQLAVTILEKIHYLHERNIILGDINPFNILVVSPTEVYFVDVDSYQIEGFPCPVGTDNYTAPEIQGKHFPDFLRSFGNEYFAVATLLFSILFLGKSPYSQTGGDTNAENIKNMDFPYTFGKEERAENTPKGQWRYIWSNLPYKVKEAFYQTFQKGQPHSSETTRLSTKDWLDIMRKYYRDLHSGRLTEQDEIANDIFPNRFKMLGENRKNLMKCFICEESFPKWQLNHGICRSCSYKGEEYNCGRCGKELIFTNFEKHVRKMTKRFEYCRDCNTYYKTVYQYNTCTDCGTRFGITYRDKEFYDSKGYHYPRRCYDCRKGKSSQNHSNNYTYTGSSQKSQTTTTSKNSKKSRSWCFLTTAACEYFGLPDDCYELNVLRSFRDQWLLKQSYGPDLVEQYYQEAPSIVKRIKASIQFDKICEDMMYNYILPCVKLIEQRKFEECKQLYIELFNKLSKSESII